MTPAEDYLPEPVVAADPDRERGEPSDAAHALSVELRGVARLLDHRNSEVSAGLPAASREYLLYGIARLLESVADATARGEPVPRNILEHAVQIARHANHYFDSYPTTTPDPT